MKSENNLEELDMNFSEWRKIELGELIDSISIKHKFDKNQLIFLNTSDVLEGKVLHQNYSDINTLPGQAKKSIKKGDILFSEIRPKNKRFALVDFDADDYVVSTKLMVLRRKNSLIDNLFLYKYLTSDRILEELQFIAEGRSGTFPQITFNELKSLKISLPLLNEQKAIVDILSSLDDKIELNNQMNKTLEEMAQALFKRWFVDFEFPNEEGQPYKSSGGEMVESELGMIPKGWEVLKAQEYYNITIGKTPPRKESHWFSTDNKDVKWISISDLGANGTFVTNTNELLTKDAIKKHNVQVVPPGTVVLSFKLTVGRVAITAEEMTTNEAIAHFKKEDDSVREYTYFYLKNFNYESLGNTSSIAKAVNSKIIKSMPILIPNKSIIEKYHSIVFQIFENIKNNRLNNESLKQTRDTLLSKLMSGEIRVSDLES